MKDKENLEKKIKELKRVEESKIKLSIRGVNYTWKQ